MELQVIDPQLRKDLGLDPYDLSKSGQKEFEVLNLNKITCQCPKKIKFMKIFNDQTHEENEVMCWTCCRHTTLAAAKRQVKAAPIPDPLVADDFVKHSMKIINEEIGEELTNFGYSVKDWYNHLNSKKQKAIQSTIDYYMGKTFRLTKKEIKQLIRKEYAGILKEELQKLDGKPRNVCAIPQRVKFIMGPVTWALEEICADKLNGYCGNKNLAQMQDKINHYLAQGFTKVAEGDGSAFDNTQDVSLKELDRQIYAKILPAIYHVPKDEFAQISQQLVKEMNIEEIKNGKRKVLIHYKVLGTVFSGDCDTTLMNTIRMAMYNRYVNDKAGLVYGKDYVCFSKGDDFTVMYKPYVKDSFITKLYYRYFLEANPDPSKPDTRIGGLGQVLKFLDISDGASIKFCSLRAWWLDEAETSIYLTRDPGKFYDIGKYSRKAKSYGGKQLVAYLNDQAIAYEKSYPGIRIFMYMAEQYRLKAKEVMRRYKITNYDMKQYMSTYLQRLNKSNVNYMKTQDYKINIKYFEELEKINEEYVKHRKERLKIVGDAEDFYKALMNTNGTVLTAQQIKLVNQQIEAEFSMEYLKSMIDVGP